MTVEQIEIIRVHGHEWLEVNDEVVVEKVIEVNINDQFFRRLVVTPELVEAFGMGLMITSGFVQDEGQIASVEYLEEKAQLNIALKCGFSKEELIQTSGCAFGMVSALLLLNAKGLDMETSEAIKPLSIFNWMQVFNHKSDLFRATGGVHSVMLIEDENEYFAEDIGRHNAIDKVVGLSLQKRMTQPNVTNRSGFRIIFLSGRISSEMVAKAIQAQIPIIVSRSAPTSLGIELAQKNNITLVGFARGNRMNIYTHPHRISRR